MTPLDETAWRRVRQFGRSRGSMSPIRSGPVSSRADPCFSHIHLTSCDGFRMCELWTWSRRRPSDILETFTGRAMGRPPESARTIRCNDLRWTESRSLSSSGVWLDSHSRRVERSRGARRMPTARQGKFAFRLGCARGPVPPRRTASRPRNARWREGACPRTEGAGSTRIARPDWRVKRVERVARLRQAKEATAGPEEAEAMEPAGMRVRAGTAGPAARVKGAGTAPRRSPRPTPRRT
jgi:hypothetical protein